MKIFLLMLLALGVVLKGKPKGEVKEEVDPLFEQLRVVED